MVHNGNPKFPLPPPSVSPFLSQTCIHTYAHTYLDTQQVFVELKHGGFIRPPPIPELLDKALRLHMWVCPDWASQVALVVKNPPASARDMRDVGLIPGLRRSLGEGNGNALQYSCLEKCRGWRSLAGYGPWGRKELETIEQLNCFTHLNSLLI